MTNYEASQPDHKTATHPEPAWGEKADFRFRVPIDLGDGEPRYEQLCGAMVAENRYMLCCIPFFTYGLSLGDEIEVAGDAVTVVQPSRQTTFRIWFEGQRSPEFRHSVMAKAMELSLPMEWSSARLLAISAAENEATEMQAFLDDAQTRGWITYEKG